MHEANEVNDGLWKVSQNVNTRKVSFFYCGQLVAEETRAGLMKHEELMRLLMVKREELRNE